MSLIFSPIIGKLSDKYGKHKIFSFFLLLAIIPVFLLTHLTRVPYYYVLIVTTLFFILASGRMVPAQALITSVVPPNLRGGFMNLNSSIQQLGIGLSAFIGGLIISQNSVGELINYNLVGYLSISISLVCLYVSTKVKVVS